MGLGFGFSQSKSKSEQEQTSIQGGTGDFSTTFKKGSVMGPNLFGTQIDFTKLAMLGLVGLVLIKMSRGK